MYGNPVKSPFSSHSTGRGEASVNNHHIARGGKGESREEKRKSPVLSPPFSLSLLPAYAISCIHLLLFHPPHPTHTHTHTPISPLYVSISFAFLPSQSCFFHSCVPGGRLLKGRWNWMPPSQSFPLRLVGDFVLLEWVVTARWLIMIQNINCLSQSAMALNSSEHSGQQTCFCHTMQYIHVCSNTLWFIYDIL